jgi:hypothetical protein
MKKLILLIPVLAIFASCKSTTVVEAPRPTNTNTIVPVPVPSAPTMTRETSVHTEYPVTRSRTSTTTVYP